MTKKKKIRDKNYQYNYYLVSFLDLLGQKEELKNLDGLLTADLAEKEKIYKHLANSVGVVLKFRESFKSYFKNYLSTGASKTIPPELKRLHKTLNKHAKINFQGFSDSTIIWIPIYARDESEYPSVLNSIHGTLMSVASMMLLYFSNGIAFRGGIDIEGGIEISSREIYGPALLKAYDLECNKAEYPRVLLGNDLMEFFEYVLELEFKDESFEKYCKMMVIQCKQWIVVDEDNSPMIHFLGPSMYDLTKRTLGSSIQLHPIVEQIDNFISDCERKFQNNLKLLQRYQRLRMYFDKYSKNWK